MAKTVITMLTDDLDGSEADETVSFAFRGTSYEVDLSAKHANEFEKAIGKYLDMAQKVSSGRVGRGTSRRPAGPAAGDIRSWARDNGFEVNDRGRVPAEVREAFEAVH